MLCIPQCSLCLRRVAVQTVNIELLDVFEDNQHSLLLMLLFNVLRCHFPFVFLDYDIVVLSQNAAGFRKVHMFMFHDEGNGITAFATDEAMADVLGRTHIERGVLVRVERTLTFPVDAAFL